MALDSLICCQCFLHPVSPQLTYRYFVHVWYMLLLYMTALMTSLMTHTCTNVLSLLRPLHMKPSIVLFKVSSWEVTVCLLNDYLCTLGHNNRSKLFTSKHIWFCQCCWRKKHVAANLSFAELITKSFYWMIGIYHQLIWQYLACFMLKW